MIKTFLMAVLLVLAIVSFVVGTTYHSTVNDQALVRRSAKITGSVLVFFLAVLVIFACTFRVGAKEYGVLTTYGKVNGNYDSGIHLKAPWQRNVTVDGRVKVYGFMKSEETGFDNRYTCIPAVIGNGTPTCVDVTIRWQITEDQAGLTYSNYGSTDDPTQHFGEAVIRAQTLQVIPIVIRGYNPITQLKVIGGKATGTSAENASFAPDYDALSRQAQDLLQGRVNGEATIQSVAISSVPLDTATQQKLSQFIQEQAKTRTALQAIETNKNVAQANQELQKSLEQSPGLLVSKCLDELADAIAKGYTLPAGFSCFGGSSVVIPGTGK